MQEMEPLILNEDYEVLEKELEQFSKVEQLRIEINEGLERELKELQDLSAKLPKAQAENLFDKCTDSVLSAITGQFGLAAVVLDSQDGGNVTTTHNFEQGIVANQADGKKYEGFAEEYDRKGKHKGYDKLKDKIRDESPRSVTSEYTGEEGLRGKGGMELDHVIPINENNSNPKMHLFLDKGKREGIVNNPENLKWLSKSANASKGDKDLMQWGQEKDPKTGQSNFEKYGISKEKAQEIYNEAKKSIEKPIKVEQFKKYSSELLKTGTKDAVNMAMYSAFGVVFKDFMQGIMIELKKTYKEFGNESIGEIFKRFKERIQIIWQDIKAKWKDILKGSLEGAIQAFLSNIVVFVINVFATTLKSLVRIIRAGFTSLYKAIKILVNPPKDMPQEEVMFEASKILVAGMISSLTMLGAETIKTWLLGIPGLNVVLAIPVPFTSETLADALALCLSAAGGAMLSTIALYYMDKWNNDSKASKLQIQIMTQGGVVVQYKMAQTWFVLHDAYVYLDRAVQDTTKILQEVKEEITRSGEKAQEAINEAKKAIDKLREFRCRQDIKSK